MDVREKLVEQLREVASKTPPICRYDNPDEIEHFGKTITVYCKPFEQFQELMRDAADYIANGITVQELALPEQDYYVLRNTETGMYFRGKGVNRWGKHFNQATIYRVKGTAEHNIKEAALHGEKVELVRIKIVEMPQPQKGE